MRPRLALPFTVLCEPGRVRLVCGEDHRYTLEAPGLDEWLPDLLRNCRGALTIDQLMQSWPEQRRDNVRQILSQLSAERVLVDGTAAEAHSVRPWRVEATGNAALADGFRTALSSNEPTENTDALHVLCQTTLDYGLALDFQRERRQAGEAWLWVSTGAAQRGYISPPFFPDSGPCFECLWTGFRRLSPAPELYDALLEHAHQGGRFEQTEGMVEMTAIVTQIALWKCRQLGNPVAPASLYRLHVVEGATLETSTHVVLPDPYCAACGSEGV